MSQIGMGVLLAYLAYFRNAGSKTDTYLDYIGKTITELELKDDSLYFTFADGSKIAMFDNGQSCCEYRYMTTDDDLLYFVGAKLVNVEVLDGPDIDDGHDCHEMQFLHVTTSEGVFTVETHNEHNGYYGGFALTTKVLQMPLN